MATPSAQFSLTLRVALPSRPGGVLGKVTAAITRVGGSIVAVDTVAAKGDRTIRELAVSYVEAYFNLRRQKTLRRYSSPFDLSRFTAATQTIRYGVRERYLWELFAPPADDPPRRRRHPRQTHTMHEPLLSHTSGPGSRF